MDWSQMSVSRDRILSDGGDWDTYLESYQATPPIDPYAFTATRSYMASRVHRRIWDVVTPEYKRKMNEGQIISSDMIDVSLRSSFKPMLCFCNARSSGSYTTQYTYGNRLGVNDANGIVTPPSTLAGALAIVSDDAGSLRAEAVSTAFARVDVSELEVLASLGEMPETVEWFRDVLRRLIGIMSDIKKRQYLSALNRLKLRRKAGVSKNAKKVASGAEDGWMEWRYAIRPLIFEVQAYLDALDTSVEKAVRKTARFRNLTVSDSIEHPSELNPIIYAANVQRDVHVSRSIRSGVMYELDPGKMGWWTHLGLDAPISAAWAVTSLSFVLDWFFNIGQWIASWEPRLGLTPLTSWVVETRSVEITGHTAPTGVPWPYYVILDRNVIDGGEYSCTLQVKARWVNPDRQILPTFRYKGLKVAQVADLVIIGRKLASQLLR